MWGHLDRLDRWRTDALALPDTGPQQASLATPGSVEEAQGAPLLALSFSTSGGIDVSAFDSAVVATAGEDEATAPQVKTVNGSTAYYLSDGTTLETDEAAQIYAQDAFTLALSFQRADLGADTTGDLVYLFETLRLRLLDDDRLQFELTNATGETATLRSDQAIADTAWHHIAVTYDSAQSAVTLYLDGQETASEPLTGLTPAQSYWGLQLGNKWGGDTAEGWIQNVVFLPDAASAEEAAVLSDNGGTWPELDPAPQPDVEGPLQVVLSYGQSLSVGGTFSQTSISQTPAHPGQVVEAQRTDSGTAEFVDLVMPETNESPYMAMMNRLVGNFERDGLDAPTMVGAGPGVSGRALIELLLGAQSGFGSVQAGLSGTKNSQFFYVHEADASGKPYKIYVNDKGSAWQLYETSTEPLHYDLITEDFEAIKAAADAAQAPINDDLLFSFIQGQSDENAYRNFEDLDGNGRYRSSVDTLNYEITYADMLDRLVSKIDASADRIFEQDITVLSVVGQTGSSTDEEQIHYVGSTENSYLGAVEKTYQMQFPAAIDMNTGAVVSSDTTHLNPVGSNLMGQDTGDVLYDALRGKNEDGFLHLDAAFVQGSRVVVKVDGLEGQLVEDTSIYVNAPGGGVPPAHLGFTLTGYQAPDILAAEITGKDEVTLTLSEALPEVDRSFALALGQTYENQNGDWTGYYGLNNPLRDSVTTAAENLFGVSGLENQEIARFLPQQKLYIDAYGTTGSSLDAALEGDRAEVNGTAECETLMGGAMADMISGGDGNDTLNGRAGFDVLMGGAGNDIFVLDSPDGVDSLLDFDFKADLIDISGLTRALNLNAETVLDRVSLEMIGDGVSAMSIAYGTDPDDYALVAEIYHGRGGNGWFDLDILLDY
ncbi:MAG: LamG-like jellyroll fold domain-containing protein [Pseudomonadota bacterium]